MGRKSLKSERVEAILTAFEKCLELKGLQATTLDDIADQSGMARRMVRHYIGNRDDVISAGVQHIIEKFSVVVDDVLNSVPSEQRFNTALHYIFSEKFNDHPSTKHVAALFAVCLYEENVAASVLNIYTYFLNGLKRELSIHKPQSNQEAIDRTAYTIMCLAFGGGWMRNIGFDHTLNTHNLNIAQSLINKL